MSRMNQLKALAKEAKQKGDKEKYEQIRGDIFKEFDFDIGKFGVGGAIRKVLKKIKRKKDRVIIPKYPKTGALPKYLKGKKFDDPDFYDLIDKNEIKKKSLGGIFRGKGALLPLFGLAGIAKYMDQNRKSSTVQPAKEVKPITMGEEATGVSKEETEGMSQGGMARGGGSAIRGTKFKGVF